MFQKCVWLLLCRKLIQLFDYLLHTLLRKKIVLQNHLLMIFYSTSLFVISVVSPSDPIYGSKCMFKVLEIQLSESISFSEILLFIAYMKSDIEDCMGHIVLFSWNVHFHVQFLHLQEFSIRNCLSPRSKSVTFCSRWKLDSIMKPWSWSPALMSVPCWSGGLSCHPHSKAVCHCFWSVLLTCKIADM